MEFLPGHTPQHDLTTADVFLVRVYYPPKSRPNEKVRAPAGAGSPKHGRNLVAASVCASVYVSALCASVAWYVFLPVRLCASFAWCVRTREGRILKKG